MLFDFDATMNEDEIHDMIGAMLRKETMQFNSSLTRLYQNQELAIEQRNWMLKWSFKLIDFNQFSKEIVAVTFSNLDRFLLTKHGHLVINDKTLFLLAAFGSLSIAIKMLASRKPYLGFSDNLSNGLFPSQDIVQMENIIMNALQWNLNPPTVFSFIELFVELLHRKYKINNKNNFKDYLFVQAEKVLSDTRILNIRPSIIAAALILSSIKSTEHLLRAQKSFSDFPFFYNIVPKIINRKRNLERKISYREKIKRVKREGETE